jgi:hypothetical protein
VQHMHNKTNIQPIFEDESLLDVTPCSLVEVDRRFRFVTLMMESLCISETSVYFNKTTRLCIPESYRLHTRCLENLKFCRPILSFDNIYLPISFTQGINLILESFSSVTPGKCRNNALNCTMTPFFHILSNSSFTHHFFFRRYIVRVTEKVYLHELSK